MTVNINCSNWEETQMAGPKLSEESILAFRDNLILEEKSTYTTEKYLRDVCAFFRFAGEKPVTKELVMDYKKALVGAGYAACSVNSMLASVNSLLSFLGWGDCKVKNLRVQRQTYCAEEKELSKAEYMRLLEASGKNTQLSIVLQTICGTGIRVSELRYFTVEAVQHGRITVSCKSKTRTILVPGKLKNLLLNYARQHRITAGPILLGRNGKPLDRSSILAADEAIMQIRARRAV